jgi:hypothetical protein
VIEGARALPWLEHARKNDPTMLDCTTCQQTTTPAMRREMACGFLPESPTTGMRWSAEGQLELTTCAGYTTTLPDVDDAAGAYCHYQQNALDLALSERPPSTLMDILGIMKGSASRLEAHLMRQASEKGKG